MTKITSALQASRLKKPGVYSAGEGLYLQVSSPEVRSWILRYQMGGRRREMGLGDFPLVGLRDAREKARAARQDVKEGKDPIEARKEAQAAATLAAARAMTFRACAEQYIESHKAGWRNPIHAAQWPSTLAAYVYPVFGQVAVPEVDLALVMKVLQPI